MEGKQMNIETANEENRKIKRQSEEEEQTRNNYLKRYFIPLTIFGLLLAIFVFFVWPVYQKAAEIGKMVGETGGRAAGIAVGSFQGITEGIPKGWEDGKEQGLSAKDTEVDVIEKIEEIGMLEVMVASVRLDDTLKIADDYSAVYVYKADAVFSVNLKDAGIQKESGKIIITLEKPSVEFYINETATEKVAEWQRHFYSGKTEDGYVAYINSRAEIERKAPEEIRNYDTLINLANDSAKMQLNILVKTVCGEDTVIEILFAGEKE